MERGASWLLKFDLRNGFSKECSKVMRKLSVRLLFVMLSGRGRAGLVAGNNRFHLRPRR